MPKKKGRSNKKQNQTSGRLKNTPASKRKDSSTSTSTDFNNELFIDVDRLNLNEEDENFFRNLVLSNKINSNLQLSSRPKGLVNLGNTCYLNSVIQILSQTPFFYELLNKRADPSVNWQAINRDYFKNCINNPNESSTLNLDNFKLTCKLGAPSILISCLVSLLRNLTSELKSSLIVVTPSNFVREIAASFSQFKNYDQQDSHEFLRCLLDAIRINEVNRQRKSILESLNLDSKKVKLIKENDKKLAEVKAYSDSSNFTVIDSLFGGYCISSLKCEDCNFTSQIFEPFFDLSLPISEESDNLNRRQQQQQQQQQNQRANQIKQKRNAGRTKANQLKEQSEIENSSNLENENVKNLSVKERKLRRQLKKATRRENKKARLNEEEEDLKEEEDEQSDLFVIKSESIENKNKNKQLTSTASNELKVNKYYKKSSTLDEEEEEESKTDGESSDDEASSNEFSELKNDFSEDCSNKQDNQQPANSGAKNFRSVQSNNSIDSGINSSNLTSEADNSSKIKNLVKTISPVHELQELTDCEANDNEFNKSDEFLNQINNNSDTNNNKESDTGFEDKNVEADSESEESNGEKVNQVDDDSDEEKIELLNANNNQTTTTFQDNDNVFMNNKSEEEKKSVRSSSALESSDLFKRKIKWTLTTVSNHNETSSSISCSVLAGLANYFTKPDILVGVNKILCENCSLKFKNKNGISKKIYTNGSKQMLIALPPAILSLQLKRFELSNYRNSLSLSKINKYVHFPLVFDLSPYVSNIFKTISGLTNQNKQIENAKSIIYSLYGIIEHSGSLRSGHYKCYVRCNNKESTDLEKFIRLQPYVPKVTELMDLITLDDLERSEEEEQLNEMLKNMHLTKEQQLNGDCSNESTTANQSTNNLDATNKIKEELIRASKEKWFHISDSNVTPIQLKNVLLKTQAYLLFYERRF